MKKLYKMLYMAAAVLLAAACSPEEDDIFSDSSANRADAAIAADMQVLTGAANGWLMEYYPEASQMYGGYNILLSFSEDGRVTVAGDIVTDPTATATSLFSVKQSAGIVLSFDTYNEIFHFFSDPGNSTGGGNGYGLEGDYDFLILEATPQQVRLKGKKSGSYAVLTPMEGDWAAYIQEVQAAEAAMQANSYQISDGTNTASVSVNYRNMTISYQEGEEALSMPAPFIVTPTGYKFYEPITLWGKTLTGFTYDAASDSFTETSGTGITMIKIIPPINEQFVSGTWYMSYSGLGSFGQHYFDAVTPYLESEGEELVYAVMGDAGSGFGFYFQSGPYAGILLYAYQLIGEDQIALQFGYQADNNGSYYFQYLGFINYLNIFGYSSARTFTITTDNEEAPSYLILTDNNNPANTIRLSASQVLYPYDN